MSNTNQLPEIQEQIKMASMNSKATRQFKNELRALRTENEITIHAKCLAREYPQFVREVNTALFAVTTERLFAK